MSGSEKIAGILFDKDGTLTDFHATWVPAYRAAAGEVERVTGFPGTVRRLMTVGGFDPGSGRCAPSSVLACGSNAGIARVWAAESGVDCHTVLDLLERTFAEQAAERAVPATDLESLFSDLTSRGLVLGIATMDSEALAHRLLSNLRVQRFFRFVCGYDSGFGEKPAPGMVQAFCAASGLSASEIMMVGDTPHDLNMGRNAGVAFTVGVLSGASDREALAPLSDRVVAHIGELADLLPWTPPRGSGTG